MTTQPLVLIAGGSSAAGIAVAETLLEAGMRVLTVGSDAGRITAAAQLTSGAVPLVTLLILLRWPHWPLRSMPSTGPWTGSSIWWVDGAVVPASPSNPMPTRTSCTLQC